MAARTARRTPNDPRRWFEDAIELLYLAHRDLVAEPDALLARRGLARVHHRILYCVARYPAITIGQLCRALGVTKQAVHAPLAALEDGGLVVRTIDAANRRQRSLRLSRSGELLEARLEAGQRRRFQRAFRAAGPRAVTGWTSVMSWLASRAPRRRK